MSRPPNDVSVWGVFFLGGIVAVVLAGFALGDLWRKLRGWLSR